MTKRATSGQRCRWLLGVMSTAIAIAIAIGLIIYLMSGETPFVGSQQNSIAESNSNPQDEQLNEALPGKTSITSSVDEANRTIKEKADASDGDIILHLRLPEKWPEACPCYLHVFPARDKSGLDESGQPIEIIPEETLKVPLRIAVDSVIHVRGSNILNVIAGVEREQDGFQIVDAVQNPKDGVPEAKLRKAFLSRGDLLEIEVLPLVAVRAVITDGNANPFLTAAIGWSLSWNLGFTDTQWPINDNLDGSRYDDTASAIWVVPAGATVVISPNFQVGGWAVTPKTYRGTVPTDRSTHTIPFTLENTVIGRIRVLSPEGVPLSTARVGSGRMPESEVRPSTMLTQAPTNREAGIYAVLLKDIPHRIIVGAPQCVHQVVNSEDVPTDGSALDVTLQYGQPLLVVRVEFSDSTTGSRHPIQLKVRTPTREKNPYLRNPPAKGTQEDPRTWLDQEYIEYWWSGTIDLPPDGEVKLLGQPPGLPRVTPISEHYEFELIERGLEGGLPLRCFLARPVTGVRVKLVDTNGTTWSRDQAAILLVARALPGDGTSGYPAAPDVPFYGVTPSNPLFIRLSPGAWLFRVSQGNLIGKAEITLDAGLKDIEITPKEAEGGWVELTVNDLTRECSAAGTTFFTGYAPLASMESAREDAVRLAKWLAEEKYPDTTPKEGRVTQISVACIAAHRDGKLMAPNWLPDRLIVMPKDKLAVYEGTVNWESRTVTVLRPTWACSVTFEPRNSNEEDAVNTRDTGWFIAIREYHDENDPVTVKGMDSKVKVSAKDGMATVDSLPAGKYVAYYVRAGQVEVRDPDTGKTEIRTNLEWCDAATFVLETGHASVVLPTIKTR